jgi:riboflavin synthase
MFTGIVEEAGVIERLRPGPKSTELFVRSRRVTRALRVGASCAVNGACLTVVARRGALVRFDVLAETLRRTNFGQLRPGSLVNLERALRADGRLEGHFVQGHVDGTGTVRRWQQVGKDYLLEVTVPARLRRYVVEKGSIAIDGISLTVAAVRPDGVQVWIIPHTRAVTNLRARHVGEKVNLEVDILAKYVERVVCGRRR